VKDNCVSIEEFWNVARKLAGDCSRCLKTMDDFEPDTPERAFWYRMYARSAFALVEGATYRMMYHAYMASERPGVSFTDEEFERLEKAYDFDESGDPTPVFMPALISQIFTIEFSN